MPYFTKQPGEQYEVAVRFLAATCLPANTSIVSGTVSAIDLIDNSSATALVLDTTVLTLENIIEVKTFAGVVLTPASTLAKFFVKGGIDAHMYKITLVLLLAPGNPIPQLEEEVFMLVQAL